MAPLSASQLDDLFMAHLSAVNADPWNHPTFKPIEAG